MKELNSALVTISPVTSSVTYMLCGRSRQLALSIIRRYDCGPLAEIRHSFKFVFKIVFKIFW